MFDSVAQRTLTKVLAADANGEDAPVEPQVSLTVLRSVPFLLLEVPLDYHPHVVLQKGKELFYLGRFTFDRALLLPGDVCVRSSKGSFDSHSVLEVDFLSLGLLHRGGYLLWLRPFLLPFRLSVSELKLVDIVGHVLLLYLTSAISSEAVTKTINERWLIVLLDCANVRFVDPSAQHVHLLIGLRDLLRPFIFVLAVRIRTLCINLMLPFCLL